MRTAAILVLVLLSSLNLVWGAVGPVSNTAFPGQMAFERTQVLAYKSDGSPQVALYWTVDKTNGIMQMGAQFFEQSPRWFGIGFSQNAGMLGADMVVARRVGGGVELYDMHSSTAEGAPQMDEIQDAVLTYAHMEATVR